MAGTSGVTYGHRRHRRHRRLWLKVVLLAHALTGAGRCARALSLIPVICDASLADSRPAYLATHEFKNLYRLIPCIPECPNSGAIIDRFTRAADFRSVTETCVDNGNGEETCTVTLAHPAVDPTSGVYEGGYRPKNAKGYTRWCSTDPCPTAGSSVGRCVQSAACGTLAGCAQACFDAPRSGQNGACNSFTFKPGDNQCKFYRTAYRPRWLREHASKQFYHLTVGNCLPAR